MLLKTSNGKTIKVDFAVAPTTSGQMVVKMQDDERSMMDICAAFESVELFEYVDETKTDKKPIPFEGWTKLIRVSKENEHVMVVLTKPKKEG